ncbi:hypothetical protein BXZ70DRAFT_358337 [Cristinia sonorae]|uniref:Protein kinase domain-containing protein n=1 Tax=Cristinia sonorae TaxID=1940300 RepID=A0A8K0UK71_9AGAR|nr:hypothetical protein BXZ70DRAFT_358337 [Cristinia sonorae]
MHDPTVLNVRLGPTRGVLEEWMKGAIRSGSVSLKEINATLAIECGEAGQPPVQVSATKKCVLGLPAPEIDDKTFVLDVSLVKDCEDTGCTMNISSAAHLLLDAQTPPASPLLLSPVVACADLSATLINIAPAALGGITSDHVTEEKVAQIEDATTTEPVVAVPVAVLVGGEVVSCAEVTNAEAIPVTDAALPVEAANTPELAEVIPGPVATDINVQVTEANKAAPALEEIAPVSRNEDEVPVSPVAETEHGALPCYTKPLSLEDFNIIKRLGSGGFGTVFAAIHKATGGACAIKVTERPSDGEGNADRMNEFTAGEQTAMLRMDGTPGVIELLGAWYDSKNVYNVMPLYAGDLTSGLRYRKAFPEARVRFYAAELVQALAALHEDKVVHRDIKPANLLTSEDGHVTVADLGLARSFLKGASDAEKMMCASYHEVDENDYGEMNEVTNSGCGTSTHMAPEVLNGQLYDYKADIWSMGITVFELVFGHHPWPHVRTEPELVRAIIREGVKIDEKECIAKGVSEGMQAFLRQTLSMEPKSRPSAQQLMDHDMFYGIIWDELREFEVPASWRHGSGIKPDQTPPSIAHGTPIDPATDPFPFLTFQSQKLSQLPRHTAAVDDEQATTKAYVAPDTIDAAFSGFSMEPESDAPSFLWEVPVGPVVAPPAPLSNLNPFRDPSRPLNNNHAPAVQPASASLDPFRDPSHPLILKSIPAAQLPSLLHLDTFGPSPPADRRPSDAGPALDPFRTQPQPQPQPPSLSRPAAAPALPWMETFGSLASYPSKRWPLRVINGSASFSSSSDEESHVSQGSSIQSTPSSAASASESELPRGPNIGGTMPAVSLPSTPLKLSHAPPSQRSRQALSTTNAAHSRHSNPRPSPSLQESWPPEPPVCRTALPVLPCRLGDLLVATSRRLCCSVRAGVGRRPALVWGVPPEFCFAGLGILMNTDSPTSDSNDTDSSSPEEGLPPVSASPPPSKPFTFSPFVDSHWCLTQKGQRHPPNSHSSPPNRNPSSRSPSDPSSTLTGASRNMLNAAVRLWYFESDSSDAAVTPQPFKPFAFGPFVDSLWCISQRQSQMAADHAATSHGSSSSPCHEELLVSQPRPPTDSQASLASYLISGVTLSSGFPTSSSLSSIADTSALSLDHQHTSTPTCTGRPRFSLKSLFKSLKAVTRPSHWKLLRRNKGSHPSPF